MFLTVESDIHNSTMHPGLKRQTNRRTVLDLLLNDTFLKVGILKKYDEWLIGEKTTSRVMTRPVLKFDMNDRRFLQSKSLTPMNRAALSRCYVA